MAREDGRPAGDERVEPDEDERSGAFVARVWQVEGGLRARVRHNLDLLAPDEITTVWGVTDDVVADLVARFRGWIEAFADADRRQ